MSKTGENQYIFQKKKKTKFAILKTIDFNFKTPTKYSPKICCNMLVWL